MHCLMREPLRRRLTRCGASRRWGLRLLSWAASFGPDFESLAQSSTRKRPQPSAVIARGSPALVCGYPALYPALAEDSALQSLEGRKTRLHTQSPCFASGSAIHRSESTKEVLAKLSARGPSEPQALYLAH